MTKTYKVNGKEIKMDEASPRDVLVQLLEALTNKEESKDLAFDDFLENKYGQREKTNGCIHQPEEHYSCADCARVEPKQEEIIKEYRWDKNTGRLLGTFLADTPLNENETRENPKQEDVSGYTALLINPTESTTGSGSKLLIEIKQSTGLKGETTNLIEEFSQKYGDLLYTKKYSKQTADKILKLIQSHLVKEIEEQGKRVAPENYNIYQARQDIIKIINNLTK